MISLTGLVARHCAQENILPAKYSDLKLGPKTFPHKLYDENDNEYEFSGDINIQKTYATEDTQGKSNLYFYKSTEKPDLVKSAWSIEVSLKSTGCLDNSAQRQFITGIYNFSVGCYDGWWYYGQVSLNQGEQNILKYTLWSDANSNTLNGRCENLSNNQIYEKLNTTDMGIPSSIARLGLSVWNMSIYSYMNTELYLRDVKFTLDNKIIFAY